MRQQELPIKLHNVASTNESIIKLERLAKHGRYKRSIWKTPGENWREQNDEND